MNTDTQAVKAKPFYLGTSIAAGAISQQSLVIAPLLVSVIISGLHLSDDSAGLVMSTELMATALISFIIASKIAAFSLRNLALVGSLILIAGCTSSMFASDMNSLYLSRGLMGIGAGFVLASSNACVAAAPDPDRLYAFVVLTTGTTHLLLLSVGPVFSNLWSYSGVYGMQAGFTILLLPFLFLIPHFPSGNTSSSDSGTPSSYSRLHALAICVAVLLFFAHNGAVWAFSQEIGRRTGMTDQQIGLVLGITGFVCLLGAVAAAVLSTRIGRLIPLMGGIFTCMVLGVSITLTDNAIVYTICQTFYQAAMFFTVPYLFGLAAKLDRHGRAMALAAGGMPFGSALGPGVAGFLIERGGYILVASFIVAAIIAAVILSLRVYRYTNEHRR